jgi:hypothetical protein
VAPVPVSFVSVPVPVPVPVGAALPGGGETVITVGMVGSTSASPVTAPGGAVAVTVSVGRDEPLQVSANSRLLG